ncbi:MAG TPA: hypothetical protein VFH47_07540, partial [Candidatus Thermoplasmatota archaeon]|nr:hypothetical protein [Candidatus Thermoplasmatota archaeon]
MPDSSAPRWALSYLTRHVGEPLSWRPVHGRAVLFEVRGRAVLVWCPLFGRVRHQTLPLESGLREAGAEAAPREARPAASERARAFSVASGSSADEAEADVEEMLAGGYEVHGSRTAQLGTVHLGSDGKPLSRSAAQPVAVAAPAEPVPDAAAARPASVGGSRTPAEPDGPASAGGPSALPEVED